VVLVDFWATWCAPCRISIPAMEDLHREYAPKGVQVLSVSLDEETDLIGPFAERYGMSYPVLLGAASDVAERYRVRGIPTLFLIDREGNLVRHWIGFDSDLPRQWRESLDQALGQSVT
jgi:thiol-disulfide isomerase/thioredoxin